MTWLRAAVGLTVLLVAGFATPATAQIHTCGPFEIVFRNPDLQPGTDGFISAEGQFFAQFQVIGAGADEVVTMGFSFGAFTTDFPESQVCPAGVPPQAWFSGQQIPNYRADTDASDGFFINLQTPLVPDGEYTAAVHAYNAADEELGRFWAKAIVNNCDAPGPAPPARCDGDIPQNTRNDKTGPWPMILPGDGASLPDGTTGFSVEFAEELSNFTIYLNGKDITTEMEAWDGRLWDDDLVPGYAPYGLSDIVQAECTAPAPIHQCTTLGESYRWNTRAMTNDDVIRVEAADLAGNRAIKDIHIGSSVAGGAITDAAPNLQITVDSLSKSTTPGMAVTFSFQMTNSGGGIAHPFTNVKAPAGWLASFPAHRPIDPGKSDTQELTVTPPTDAASGRYQVNATISYPEAGQQKESNYELFVTIEGGSAVTAGNSTADGRSKGSPAASPIVVLTALAAVAVALRRRRDA
ncbi:MAG: NEW3 domain-containing protein [Candidatus Thermoplasmatota archaeon]